MGSRRRAIGWKSPGNRLALRRSTNLPHHPKQRVVVLVHDALLQRNDGIIGDVDVFRADLRATLGYVAVAQTQFVAQQLGPRNAVQRMHLEPSDAHKKSWPGELL